MNPEGKPAPSQESVEASLQDLLLMAAEKAQRLEAQTMELQNAVKTLRQDHVGLRAQLGTQDQQLSLEIARREGLEGQLLAIDGAFESINRLLREGQPLVRARTDCLREVLEHCRSNLSNPVRKRIALFELTPDRASFTFPVRIGFGTDDTLQEMPLPNLRPSHLSIACARIAIGGAAIGVLSVDSRAKGDFDARDRETIDRFARLAGLVYGVFSTQESAQ